MNADRIRELLGRMTLEEKIGQLVQLTGDFYSEDAEKRTGPMEALGLTPDEVANAGSILGVGGASECRRIQSRYIRRHRLHIPTLFMADVIHGCRTIFPVPLGLGCSWDEAAAERAARVAAEESSACGIDVTFSPMADLVRDPRWGRVVESTGEDVLLNSRFAAAMVRGYQGVDPSALHDDVTRVAACVKHFAGYGAPIAGRDYNTVDMSEWMLRDRYLPAYHAAIEAGARLVMTAFNVIEGIPATANVRLQQGVLRDEWGFDGVLISDFGAIRELERHGVARDDDEAAAKAMRAGVDIDMMSVCYLRGLRHLVEDGIVPLSVVDEAVLRVLTLKNELGLFENPFRGADEAAERAVVMSPGHRRQAREVAEESMVLLRNEDGLLPLSAGRQTVALIGPFAVSHDVLGPWSWQGNPDQAVSLDAGMRGCDEDVLVGERDFDPVSPSTAALDEALELSERADVTVLALGEPSWMSGEASSRSDIRLPKAQRDLVTRLLARKARLVVVLFNGRPLDLSGLDGVGSILEAWYPGTEAGTAVARLLYGEVSPSGRLTMSFPRSVGQIPVYYDHDSTGRPFEGDPDEKYVSHYLDVPNDPAYPFGFGLTYGRVSYGSPDVSSQVFGVGRPLHVETEVHNVSDRDVTEVVQLYVHDVDAETVRPVSSLKGFQRVLVPAGASVRVPFVLREEDMRYVHSDGRTTSDPGDVDIMVGPDSASTGVPVRVRLVS
ncbi:glycoside hydrolase family 3 N-terminal domain-containing protein [uncultured Bifidobacterium sp.]|uniref:glycoside hydrolase family 3 N-terminal domain-containing protein n=1 Tax=uncultured Bifidobacterium sp. TaxID=165187 RepID=UPI0028DB6EFE|nr:glycoside hydrolase family 3 N-terminal domain-containing protein [uncultured Bifidobacterium sp.]